MTTSSCDAARVHQGGGLAVVVAETAGWRLFSGLFADAAQMGLLLIPLRPRARDPDTALAGGDYDFLMPPEGYPLLVTVLWWRSLAEGASFSVNRVDQGKIKILIHIPECGRNIVLEIWTKLSVRDPARRSARAIPWAALAASVRTTPDGMRLQPDIEIALYLSHLATRSKRTDTPLVTERLAAYLELARTHAPALVPVMEGLETARIPQAACVANAMLRECGILAVRTRVAACWDSVCAEIGGWVRRMRRRRVGRAKVLAVTGADGVGKTSMINNWSLALRHRLRIQRFKNLFRHHPAYRFFYALRAEKTRRRLGGLMPRNQFDEVHARIMFHLARATWPWWRTLVAVAGRRCLDRYFHDLLFDGLRGTTESPGLCAEWRRLARSMPQPDWHVHCDAPDAVILGRRRELSPVALRAYREGMMAVVGFAPALAFTRLDTTQSPSQIEVCLRLAAEGLGVDLPWNDVV